MRFEKGSKIVFAGDSITDDGRARPIGDGNNELGNGYVRLIDTFLAVDYPELELRCVNMGASGNTSRDLLARWDVDVNALCPDHVAVLIGINDVWRQFDSPQRPDWAVMPDEYRSNLQKIVEKTQVPMTFLLPYYVEPNRNDAMRKRAEEYAAICQSVAREHDIPYVDLQAAFDAYLEHRYPAYITWDRVHPGRIGSMIIARAFLQAIGHCFRFAQ